MFWWIPSQVLLVGIRNLLIVKTSSQEKKLWKVGTDKNDLFVSQCNQSTQQIEHFTALISSLDHSVKNIFNNYLKVETSILDLVRFDQNEIKVEFSNVSVWKQIDLDWKGVPNLDYKVSKTKLFKRKTFKTNHRYLWTNKIWILRSNWYHTWANQGSKLFLHLKTNIFVLFLFNSSLKKFFVNPHIKRHIMEIHT